MKKIGTINLTGHMHNYDGMKAYESTDSCGTCDGARCDNCKTMYKVEDFADDKTIYYGPDKDKAIEIAGYNFMEKYNK